MPVNEISEITGLTADEISNLKKYFISFLFINRFSYKFRISIDRNIV